MTTRHRRNLMEQAEDVLHKLLAKQDAVVTECQKRLDIAKAHAEATRQALATLQQPKLPGMEADTQRIPPLLASDQRGESVAPIGLDAGTISLLPEGVETIGADGTDGALYVTAVEEIVNHRAKPFHPLLASPSACPHPKTIREKDGRRVCATCGERVFETR